MGQRNAPRYPRTARVNELIREVVAESLADLDDDRIELIAVTQVVVDRELHQAVVYYDSLRGPEADDEVQEALAEHRVKLQAAIGRQTRLKRTPHLVFRADDVARGAERIEGIIRDFGELGEQGQG
jgi:ribosome-binding factor A